LTPDTELRALVAELDGRVAGMALHLFAYETAYAQRGRYLQDIAVFPWARRRGVARALIARLAALTRDEGGMFLWWMNMDTMPEGRALYRKICDQEATVVSFAVTQSRFQALADEG
ncbi:MAG: GNAT family N-acetyltransferase, partial [Pseudomonadota bacterium]